jgi:hypothetical protein
MSAPTAALGSRRRQEPPVLVVAISALQVILVFMVWLLALAPIALAAAGAAAFHQARAILRASTTTMS